MSRNKNLTMKKKNAEKYKRHLYLSTINFGNLKELGNDLKFDINLLVAYPKGSCKASYVDEVRQSKIFKHLKRKATISEIIDVLVKYQLVLYEYILKADGVTLQSITGSDVLLELSELCDVEELIITKIMSTWDLPLVKYSQHNIETIKPNILFEITKAGDPEAIKKIKSKNELIDFLLKEQQDEVVSKNKFVFKHRIYYSNPN